MPRVSFRTAVDWKVTRCVIPCRAPKLVVWGGIEPFARDCFGGVTAIHPGGLPADHFCRESLPCGGLIDVDDSRPTAISAVIRTFLKGFGR